MIIPTNKTMHLQLYTAKITVKSYLLHTRLIDGRDAGIALCQRAAIREELAAAMADIPDDLVHAFNNPETIKTPPQQYGLPAMTIFEIQRVYDVIISELGDGDPIEELYSLLLAKRICITLPDMQRFLMVRTPLTILNTFPELVSRLIAAIPYEITSTVFVGVLVQTCGYQGNIINMPYSGHAVHLSSNNIVPESINISNHLNMPRCSWLIPIERVFVFKGIAAFTPLPDDRKCYMWDYSSTK